MPGCVWLTITKLIDNEGNIVAVSTRERDITEMKRMGKGTQGEKQKNEEMLKESKS